MKKSTKRHLIAAAIGSIVTVPCGLYLLINFYWWLFDGNVLRADKMNGAFLLLTTAIFLEGMVHLFIEDA